MREINILDVKYHTVHLSLRRKKRQNMLGTRMYIHRRLLYLFFSRLLMCIEYLSKQTCKWIFLKGKLKGGDERRTFIIAKAFAHMIDDVFPFFCK